MNSNRTENADPADVHLDAKTILASTQLQNEISMKY